MYNAVTLKSYTGTNAEILAIESGCYKSQAWATFKQWLTLGRVPKQGAKGIKLKWFKEVIVEGRVEKKLQYFYVFNQDQTEILNNNISMEKQRA